MGPIVERSVVFVSWFRFGVAVAMRQTDVPPSSTAYEREMAKPGHVTKVSRPRPRPRPCS